MPGSERVAVASVKIQGIEVQATISRVEIEDGDRAIDKATIELDDATETAADTFREGNPVRVDMGWEAEHGVLFEGVITRVQVQSQARRLQRVSLQAYDLAYRLPRQPRSAEHEGALSAILRQIVTAGNYGITVGQIEPDPDPSFPDSGRNKLRQTNLRDWDFIQALALRYGARAFVEFNEGASKFYFLPARRLMDQRLGTLQYNCGLSRLLEFNYQRMSSSAAPQRSAAAVNPQSGETVQQQGQPSQPEGPPRPDPERLQRLSQQRGPNAAATYEQALSASAPGQDPPEAQRPQGPIAGLPSSPDRAEQAARSDPTLARGFVGEGVAVGSISLRAKGTVDIQGIATWAAGDWYLCQVNHIFERVVQAGQNRSTYRARIRVTR